MVQIGRNHRVFTGEGQRRVKRAWTLNMPYVFFPGVSKWKLQGEWSNAAYTAGTGYPNAQGQKGCLDGH